MSKIYPGFLACLLFPIALFSQDSLESRNASASAQLIQAPSLIVVKGDEIRRFPSTNFLDAVNGLFPWVFSQDPDPNEFLFVVDGFVLQDINAISLADIEEICFTHNNLNGILHPNSKAGIFYITTRMAATKKAAINFDSQYEFSRNQHATALSMLTASTNYTQHSILNNHTGHFIADHASISAAGRKLRLFGSLELDAIKEPGLAQERLVTPQGIYYDSTNGKQAIRQSNFHSFLKLDYKVSGKLNMGITGTYFKGRSREKYDEIGRSANLPSYVQAESSKYPLQNYHLGGFANWKPTGRLTNLLSLEYTDNHSKFSQFVDYSETRHDTLAGRFTLEENQKAYQREFLGKDLLSYAIPTGKKFSATASAEFSYLNGKYSYRSTSLLQSTATTPVIEGSISSGKERLTSLDPVFKGSYDGLISIYAGYHFLLNKGIHQFLKNEPALMYMGFTADLKKAMGIKSMNRLDISADYGNLPENRSNNYWLPQTVPDQYFIVPFIYGQTPVVIPNPSLQFLLPKNKLVGARLNSGFLKNRLLFGIEWTSLSSQEIFIVQVPIPGNNPSYAGMAGYRKIQGFSSSLEVGILAKGKFHWNARLNALLPHVKDDINGAPAPGDKPTNYVLQTGLQNKFQWSSFSIQVNFLYGLDHRSYEAINFGVFEEHRFDELSLNFLQIAYDLAGGQSRYFRNLSFFLQGRNLASSKTAKSFYQNDSYGGAGINLQLR